MWAHWDAVLSVSTALLALATIVLAVAAVWAAIVALSGLGESRKSLDAARLSLEAQQRTLEAQQGILEQSRQVADYNRRLAEADNQRRRAEASHAALRRYMATYDEQQPIMLVEARKVTAKRMEKLQSGDEVERCTITELLAQAKPPEVAEHALQRCLDRLEEIAMGVRLGIYDEYVIYHGAQSKITQNFEQGESWIRRARIGRIEHREGQPTAYEHVEWLVRTRFAEIKQEGAPTRLAGALKRPE